jgi:hypothetical protein
MMALLLELDYFKRSGKGLWLLPPLFLLWINLHGSWLFGMVVLVAFIAAGLVEGQWGRVVATRWNRSQLKRLVLALIRCGIAVFINPFGYKLVIYPFDLLSRQQATVRYLDEWQPVDFSAWNGKLALAIILALIVAILFSRRQWRLDEVLLSAFALWAALSHVRFLFFAGLIIMPILAPRLKLFSPYEPELDKPWLNAGIIATITFLMIFYFPSNHSLQQKIDEEYPTAALSFIEANHINGRIFNEYKYGGYMEWTAPQIKPFIDGRADLFVYNGIFDDFIKVTSLSNSLEILDKYKIDYVLYEPKQPLTYLLEHSGQWRPIYSDRSTMLFERTHPLP